MRRYRWIIAISFLTLAAAWRFVDLAANRRENAIRNRMASHGIVAVDGRPAWLPEISTGSYPVTKLEIFRKTDDVYFEHDFLNDLLALKNVNEIELHEICWKGWSISGFEDRANGEEILSSTRPEDQWLKSVRQIRPTLRFTRRN